MCLDDAGELKVLAPAGVLEKGIARLGGCGVGDEQNEYDRASACYNESVFKHKLSITEKPRKTILDRGRDKIN